MSGEEKLSEEHSTGTKRKLAAQASFEDDNDMDLDGFSELDKLEPELAQPNTSTTAQLSNSQIANGTPMLNGAALSGAQSAPLSSSSLSQHGQQGPSTSSGGQSSVLQELLLTQSSASTISSPRQQPSTYSNANFPTKSPMPMASASQQNMSPMQRSQLSQQQQMRQPMGIMSGQPGFDPSQSGGPIPPASYIQQGGAMIPPQQQFAHFQQHTRPTMYGANPPPVRLPPSGMPVVSSAVRQPGPGNYSGPIPAPSQGTQPKGVRQPHPGMAMPGNAPTPPSQGGRGAPPIMIGQPGPMGSQQNGSGGGAPFDSPHSYPPPQMMPNGPPPQQRQEPLNGYMMPAGGAQMQHGQWGPQQAHRIQQQMGAFGPPGGQLMPGQMDMSMVGNGQVPPSQHGGQMPPGMIANGGTAQIMPPNSRQAVPPQQPPISSAAQQQGSAQGMMVAQSPAGMLSVTPQINGSVPPQQQMRAQQGVGPMSGGQPQQAQQQQPPSILGGQGQPQDPEKRKLIQQQLVLLLHAHKCQQRDKQEGPQNRSASCTLPYCSVMKGVLEHMVNCTSGRQCQYPHCASSRQIITHWKNCSKEDCPVCNPVKKYTNGTAADRRTGDMMLQAPFQPNMGNPQQMLPGTLPTVSVQQQQQVPPSVPTSLNNNPMGSAGPSSVAMNFGSPPSQSSVTVNNLLDGYTPNPFRSTNPPNKVGHGSGMGGSSTMPSFGTNGEGTLPEPPTQPRDWHVSITPDLRNHLVGKLVKAIFPYPDPAAVHDQRIRDLLTYARKVEKDMFEAAPDKEAYYHMLAEKIYKIQKELQEKKNRRLNEQLNQQQRGDTSVPDGLAMPGMGTTGPQQQAQNSQHLTQVKQESQQPPMVNFFESSIPTKRPKLEEPGQFGGDPSASATVKQEPGTTSVPTAPASSNLFPPPAENRRSTTPKDIKPSTSAATSQASAEPIVRDPKVFDANELRQHLMPVWHKLYSYEPAVIPFREPVDPKLLNIPDYFAIIKNPMDLATIKANLDQGKYKHPWEFCDHMWLMFENAWLYNRKNTKIHKWCTQLSELFVDEINPVMRQMGYCCGQKLSFTPLVQFCFGITKNNAACVIARDQPYYMYENNTGGFGVTVAEKYIYCVKCFESLPEEGINLNEGNTNDPPNWVPKTAFQKMKNDQIDMEPYDHCQICDRKWHRICALNSSKINSEGFICDRCRTEKSRSRPENKFTAKKLGHCHLSRFIEGRVNKFLSDRLAGDDPEVEVVIRVLSSSDKEVEVKPCMLKKYGPEGYPDRFPYRSKAIFAFEVLRDPDTGHSQEVCFFGLYVQEYGTNCAQPNQRRVYIAYLDSVHFFQPRSLRTSVYYEILLGYLQYVKELGYTMAHIWACPPSEGDDYIFHCHPTEQKIPKPKRLQDWYKTMLNNGHDEGTVYSYKDIFNQAKDDALDTPMRLPYFEGDYWPRIIDECIVSAEKEEEQDRRTRQQQETEQSAVLSDDDTFQTDDGFPVKKQQQQQKSSKKKSNLKKSAASNKKKGGLNTGNPVVDKLFQQLDKHRDVFFTIRLFSLHDEQEVMARKPSIEDPDPLISCELMDTRDNFLAKSREEHWEFSQLRRAKWSTLNLCYTLHTQEQDGKGLSYTCNVCEQPACYHCGTCDDYDLCEGCRNKTSHPHEMEKLILGDEQKSVDASAASRNDSVKKCISSLVHACTCRDANCRRGTCHKMKKVIQHTKHCKRRQTAGSNCAVCKQLIALCCYHAKHCAAPKCQVPFCSQIRQKLQEQKRSQNRQAERMMQRRMMKLQSVGAMNGGGGISSQIAPQQQQQAGSSSAQWTQPPPQSPQQPPSQPYGSGGMAPAQMQIQMSAGQMMMSPNAAQQQMRMNGPTGYHQMIGSGQQMINSPPMGQQMGAHQQHPAYQQMMGNHPQQQQPPMGAGMQRVPSTSAMHAAQQQMMSPHAQSPQITSPPFVRSMQQQPPPPQHSAMPFSGQIQPQQQLKFMPQGTTQQQRFPQPPPQMRGPQQQDPQQQFEGIGQQQRRNDMNRSGDVNFNRIIERFKEASAKGNEAMGVFFTELRRTPHMFNAFLKHQKQNIDFSLSMGGGQQQIRQQQPPQQQQFAQQQQPVQYYQGSGPPPSQPGQQIVVNGNPAQLGQLPPQQWIPSQHQQRS